MDKLMIRRFPLFATHEDSDFHAGDSVMLVVQRFERDKQQMYGKILSKW